MGGVSCNTGSGGLKQWKGCVIAMGVVNYNSGRGEL